MSLDWAASLDQIWRSPNLPLYLTLATAAFVAIIVLITLLRSERSVANGVLALITLGYKQIEAHKAVKAAQAKEGENPGSDALVRAALQILTR